MPPSRPRRRPLAPRVVLRSALVVPAALAVGTVLALGACGAGPSGGDPAHSPIVTSFYPIEFATEQIAGPGRDVTVLTKPGAEPHDLEIGAQDLARMTRAGLVVYANGFQPAVDEAIQQIDEARVLDISGPADLTLEPSEDGHDDESAADHADHGTADPHFWLDPVRYAAVAKAIGARLAADDPAHAAAYAANTDAFVARLTELDTEFRTGLQQCTDRQLVTSHAAFGYLAARYGLTQHSISGISPDAEPSAAALKQIGDLVRRDGVTTIYQETLVEPQFAETVARSTGATLATLDPIEGVTKSSAGSDYFEIMRSNLKALEKGQGCR
ncbi:ABC transporter substrate-binding protein [Intrasporangium oryzae NRRL B-24470]|uniref:ABC transporter substrate-binding protein n=1 Tax=Intrasporangium oryzae NRRL B-24470 TaxID=1386089 RepID=W9GF19_9MICO|nr:metal ABC transporter substrate-binding protein [Intrasporangium oryzae]EWT03423.1 ABC transporter substrate-binding protein [Intrasporangium oryzae NRRL B-24470]